MGFIFLAPSILFTSVVNSQSTNVGFELSSTVASRNVQPLWLTSNKNGRFDSFSGNGLFAIYGDSELFKKKSLRVYGGWDMLFRASSDKQASLNRGFIGVDWLGFSLKWGRFYDVIGDVNPDLSSGSMVVSGNATPVTKIKFGLDNYSSVPFTGDWLRIKGFWAHGWLENSRFVKNAFLHEKGIHMSTWGTLPVRISAGFIHAAQWGGTSRDPNIGKLPGSFKDFWKVAFGKGGADGDAPQSEVINALGNHLGAWEFGASIFTKPIDVRFYHQHPWEDKSGIDLRNGKDGIWAVELTNKKPGLWNQFLWEFIFTKDQTGPGLSDPTEQFPDREANFGFRFNGRDNYYNNGIYKDGWAHFGRIIGTPLFITNRQLATFKPDAPIWDNAISSNRMVAHHVGLNGNASENLGFKILTTYARHYGTFRGLNFGTAFGSQDPANNLEDFVFFPPLHQWYFMASVDYSLPTMQHVLLNLAFEWDTGDLYNVFGLQAGVRWNFIQL